MGTLASALYVKIDDLLLAEPGLAPWQRDADLVSARPGQTLIGDKNYCGRDFEQLIVGSNLALLRPVRKGEARRTGKDLSKPLRHEIESVIQTLKAQLDLEGHSGTTTRPDRLSSDPSSPMTTDSNHTTRNQSSSRL